MLAAMAALASTSTAFADACLNEKDELSNYVYTKFGIARTQYKKFKEVGSYFKRAPKVAPMFHLGLGRKLAKHFRAEVNLQYGRVLYKASQDNEKLRQKIHLYGAMFNGYFDITPKEKINLYATAGLGIGVNKNGDLGYDANNQANLIKRKNLTCLIWNVGTGLRTDLSKKFSLDLGYRYVYLGKAKVVDTPATLRPAIQLAYTGGAQPTYPGGTQTIYGHQLLIAVTYNF